MKTLYISDLDGTLLSPNVTLTKRTVSILNDLMSQGLLFTVATARSIASVKHILKDLELTLPIILMNGVCIYDPLKKNYVKVESFGREDVSKLISMIEENHLKGFLYTVKNGKLATYYEELSNKALKDFHDERVSKYNKSFIQIDDFSSLVDEPLIYFTLMDYKENLEQLNEIAKELPNINSVFYKDNYSKNMWYLEIFSKNTSKYHAVQFLRNHLSLDTIVGFGDNQNDMALFDACDKSYAVENAIYDLKLRADGIIGRNTDDAVAIWLNSNGLKTRKENNYE
ncbi:MAG: HAD family hydrolase [Clostridiales bacterium]|jgi:Cof subfamily protein (haloacid dehalogenase superfamily)|nr:HAD family hydrolase [Clostridiales bacterium]